MSHALRLLHKIEVEKSDLSRRIRSLHSLIGLRCPSVARVALALYDEPTDLLRTFASSTLQGEPLVQYEARLADVPSLAALRDSRSSRVVEDVQAAFAGTAPHTAWLRGQGYCSSYTLPLFKGEHLVAFVFFDATEPGMFTPEVTSFLDPFADIVAQLYLLRLSALNTLVGAVDIATGLARIRDVETGRHLQRMARYARLVAERVASHFGFDDEHLEYIHLFAPLHDIGKVGIPDQLLLKPGRLSEDEQRQMQAHVRIGTELVDHIISDLGLGSDLAARVMHDIVAGHHERGDGSGYPLGLRLEQIPPEARIIAVADVYDAISSRRPYKDAWDEARCIAEMQQEADTGRLDPVCVAALLTAEAEREEIRRALAD